MQVIKRDGTLVPFDLTKIIIAVNKAGLSQNKANYVAADVWDELHDPDDAEQSVDINTIQMVVEYHLMRQYPDIARKYISYRHDRDTAREMTSDLYRQIDGLINKTDKDAITENANKDARVFPTQRDLLAGIVSKHYAKNIILPKDVVAAHESGDIHYHDLDYSPLTPLTNCCLVDLKGMLENGFRMGNADITTPKSIGVACALMAQITAQVASNQYGGTTFANVDVVLSPYVEMTYNKHMKTAIKWNVANATEYALEETKKSVHDAFQSFLYEVNTLHTSNGQTPFITITFGTGTDWTSKLIQKAILTNHIIGLGENGITPVFPKLVMFIEDGVNLKPVDPNYDIKQLALECASKRMYPDIISVKNNKKITGSSVPVSPMGCRSFLGVWKDENGNEVLDGRNNLGVVTVNLPRIAIQALRQYGSDRKIDGFFELLKPRLDMCFKALMTRIKSFEGVKANVSPILYTEGAFGVRLKPDDDIIELFKNGRSSISLGYIGIHEVLSILCDGHPFDSESAQKIGKLIVDTLRKETEKWKAETGYAFSLYSTPAENLCYRFCKLDKEKFGEYEGITDKGWYTNSFHLDVDRKVTPFEKIDYEHDYHGIATGGHISYVEFPDIKDNIPALEKVWDYAVEHLDYFGTNTPVDHCFECESTKEFTVTEHGFKCSECGNADPDKMSVTRRTCGYLGNPTVRGFNDGKNKEMMHRVKHQ